MLVAVWIDTFLQLFLWVRSPSLTCINAGMCFALRAHSIWLFFGDLMGCAALAGLHLQEYSWNGFPSDEANGTRSYQQVKILDLHWCRLLCLQLCNGLDHGMLLVPAAVSLCISLLCVPS